MGISMLFEEVRTTGLDITVVSGKRITEVESWGVSEDRLGVGVGSMEIDVVVSDWSTTELLSGTICELVSTAGVVSEVVGCSEALGETNIEVSGIRKPEVLSGVGAKLVNTGVRSEVVGMNETLGEKMEGETIDEGRSSMLDCMENDREGVGEMLGRTDSVRTGSEVRRDCTENITDITGTDVI